MSTDFFGTKVSADKPTPYVPRPNADNVTETLVMLNATVPASCKLPKGTRISLIVKTETCESVALATLIVAQHDNAKIDIGLDGYAEFSVMGPKGAEIHLTGHYLPKPSAEEEEDVDGGMKKAFASLLGAPSGYQEGEEEDDDDSDDDDSDQEDDDDIAPAPAAGPKKSKVEINETGEDSSDDDDDDDDGDDDDDNEDAEEATPGQPASDPGDDSGNDEEEEGKEDKEDDSDDDSSDDEEEDKEGASKENGKATQVTVAKDGKRAAAEPSAQPAQKRMKHTKFANGFEVQQLRESSNPNAPQAQLGKTIAVKYRGTLTNGKVFDETTGNKTFTFRLGIGEVIKGWDKGLAGMRVGDKRKLVVPPSMAYGSTGVPNVIPKNATLHFEVELLRVKDGKR